MALNLRQQYRNERRRRGSQRAVAAFLGVARETINRRESGAMVVTKEALLAIRRLPAQKLDVEDMAMDRQSIGNSVEQTAAAAKSE